MGPIILLLMIALGVLMILICKRAGVGWGWGLLGFLPLIGPLFVVALPFFSWPNIDQPLKGDEADA